MNYVIVYSDLYKFFFTICKIVVRFIISRRFYAIFGHVIIKGYDNRISITLGSDFSLPILIFLSFLFLFHQ